MGRHLRLVAIMIEVTSRHKECTHFNSNYRRMPVVVLQLCSNLSNFNYKPQAASHQQHH